MALYLDSAQIEEVRRAKELLFVKAVTTNPTRIAKTGRPGLDVLRDLLDLYDGPVFYQVTAETLEARIDQVWEAHEMHAGRVVIKVPAMTENYTLVSQLAPRGITFCVTAASNTAQAYLASEVGAAFVAPYVGRLTRQLGDGLQVVRDMAHILNGSKTQIVAASLKTVDDAVAALSAGAQHATVSLKVLLAFGEHELSQQAIVEFAKAGGPRR